MHIYTGDNGRGGDMTISYNRFYHLIRRRSRTNSSCVYWTGERWSTDPDDAVLFRHTETAKKYAKSCGMRVLGPENQIGDEMTVYVMEATPTLRPNAVRF